MLTIEQFAAINDFHMQPRCRTANESEFYTMQRNNRIEKTLDEIMKGETMQIDDIFATGKLDEFFNTIAEFEAWLIRHSK